MINLQKTMENEMTSVSERIRKESWHACIAPTQQHGVLSVADALD